MSISDLALVTGNFGGIDDLKPLPRNVPFDRFYYTDATTLARASPDDVATWTRVIEPSSPRHDLGPRLRAKYFKCQIHRLPETQPYRWLAWADATMLFHDVSFFQEAVERLCRMPPRSRLMFAPHPKRSTVEDEYDHVVGQMQKGSQYHLVRYSNEKMDEQMAFYKDQACNTAAKLWAGGLWLIENSATIRECWNSWWDHILRFSKSDQLSLPIVLENHDLHPQEFPFPYAGGGYFQRMPHSKIM